MQKTHTCLQAAPEGFAEADVEHVLYTKTNTFNAGGNAVREEKSTCCYSQIVTKRGLNFFVFINNIEKLLCLAGKQW